MAKVVKAAPRRAPLHQSECNSAMAQSLLTAGDPFALWPRMPMTIIRNIGQFIGIRCTLCDENRAVPVKTNANEFNWFCIDCTLLVSGLSGPEQRRRTSVGSIVTVGTDFSGRSVD